MRLPRPVSPSQASFGCTRALKAPHARQTLRATCGAVQLCMWPQPHHEHSSPVLPPHGSLNISYRTAVHLDGKNVPGSYSALIVLEVGAVPAFCGGSYLLPQVGHEGCGQAAAALMAELPVLTQIRPLVAVKAACTHSNKTVLLPCTLACPCLRSKTPVCGSTPMRHAQPSTRSTARRSTCAKGWCCSTAAATRRAASTATASCKPPTARHSYRSRCAASCASAIQCSLCEHGP